MERRPRTILLLVAAALLMLGLTVLFARRPQPTYNGRPLEDWVAMYGGNPGHGLPTKAEKEESSYAVREIGTNGLPWLLAWTAYEPPAWREKAANSLPSGTQKASLEEFLLEPPVLVRAQNSAKAFATLGHIATPAVPELIRRIALTNSPVQRQHAMLALAPIGTQAVPTMAAVLANLDPKESVWVMRCISEMGTNARPLVPYLVTNLSHSGGLIPIVSLRTLAEMRAGPEILVPALTNCLNHPRATVRMEAASMLEGFHGLAHPALPALSNAVSDPDSRVRAVAKEAIASILSETNSPSR